MRWLGVEENGEYWRHKFVDNALRDLTTSSEMFDEAMDEVQGSTQQHHFLRVAELNAATAQVWATLAAAVTP